MAEQIIIDGYNLIHRVEELRAVALQSLEEARRRLVFKLQGFLRGKKLRATIVFDGEHVGHPSRKMMDTIEIIYTLPPQKADDVIRRIVQKSTNRRNITVVSSDNPVKDYARTLGANTMRSEEFYRKYLCLEEKFEDSAEPPAMSRQELAEWLRLFGAHPEGDKDEQK